MSYHSVTVMLVEDHKMFRQGIRAALEGTKYIKVVGETDSGEEAISMAEQLAPDVIIMDIELQSGISGVEAATEIIAKDIDTRILILTRFEKAEYLDPVMSAGAMGFIRKTKAIDRLIEAVNIVAAGRVSFPKEASLLYRRKQRQLDAGDPLAELTRTEREVMKLVARGFTSQEISDQVFISVRTVENYRRRIKSKLKYKTKAEFTAMAVEAGMLRRK